MEFWQFLGNYWWLWFVFGGSIVGGVRALRLQARKASKTRHKRRLEILAAKRELEAARASGTAADTPKQSKRQAVRTRLQQIMDRHDETTRQWLDYELDVGKLIEYPAMSDGRQPLTAAFLRAKKKADSLRPDSATARPTADELSAYDDAVSEFEVAFDLAERDAKRQKDANFSEAERKRLDRAKQLITVAVDQAATPAERNVAYKRVRQELDGLIAVSDEAYTVLEKRVALQLGDGSSPVDEAVASAAPETATSPPTG